MLTTKTHTNNRQSRWLLSLAILCSIFSFAGYLHYTPPLQQPTQTELLLSQEGQDTKAAVYFCQTIEKSKVEKTSFLQPVYLNSQLSYNRLTEIQFKAFSQPLVFNKAVDRFFPIKTIPQSSDEDLFISYIG